MGLLPLAFALTMKCGEGLKQTSKREGKEPCSKSDGKSIHQERVSLPNLSNFNNIHDKANKIRAVFGITAFMALRRYNAGFFTSPNNSSLPRSRVMGNLPACMVVRTSFAMASGRKLSYFFAP